MRRFYQYKCSLLYMLIIVLFNFAYGSLPFLYVGYAHISPMDISVGVVFIFRDLAQREIGHKVFVPMIVGAILSFFMAKPSVAMASMLAFSISETTDWSVFTFTGWPLKQRLMYSAAISSPIDTLIFLGYLQQLTWVSFTAMTLSKMAGAATVVFCLRKRLPASDADAGLRCR